MHGKTLKDHFYVLSQQWRRAVYLATLTVGSDLFAAPSEARFCQSCAHTLLLGDNIYIYRQFLLSAILPVFLVPHLTFPQYWLPYATA